MDTRDTHAPRYTLGDLAPAIALRRLIVRRLFLQSGESPATIAEIVARKDARSGDAWIGVKYNRRRVERIVRDARGQIVRDHDGQPVMRFEPETTTEAARGCFYGSLVRHIAAEVGLREAGAHEYTSEENARMSAHVAAHVARLSEGDARAHAEANAWFPDGWREAARTFGGKR